MRLLRSAADFALLGGASKAVPAFVPTSFSGNVGWYDLNVSAYKDAGATKAANNDTIQQLKDLSGGNFHLNQPTAGKRPTFKTAGLNGLPAAIMSAAAATAMYAQNFPLSAGAGFTVIAVARMNAATDSYGRLVSFVSNVDGAGTGNDYTGANNGAILLRQGTIASVEAFRDLDMAVTSGYTGNAYRFGMVSDGSTVTSHLNNQFGDVFRGQSTSQAMCAASPGTLQIGGALQVVSGAVQALSGNSWDGALAELIIYNRALTALELATIDVYLSKKWGFYVAPSAGKNVIFDFDNDSDAGDAAALQGLIALQKLGKINIAAVLVNSRNNLSAEYARVVLAANGLGATPIGAFKGTTPTTITNTDAYCTTVVTIFGNVSAGRSTYPDAATVFRQAMASMPDGTGIYYSAGYAPNFAATLASAGDGIDARTGPVLFAAKISKAVIMGGNFDNTNAEFNLAGDPADWASVISNRPASVPFFWFGADWFDNVLVNPNPSADPAVSPSYKAATVAGNNQGGGVFTRPGWDVAALYAAIVGDISGIQLFGLKGSVSINATTGVSTYAGQSEGGNDNYLYWGGSAAGIAATLNALIANVA